MASLNQLTDQYAGLIAVSGLGLAVVSAVAAIYFYYNPRRPSYQIMYKVFSFYHDLDPGVGMLSTIRKAKSEYFIDVWNAGKETITKDVLREDIGIALQAAAINRGRKIVSAAVDSESHPGLAHFSIIQGEERVTLNWEHFDPRMAVRLRLVTNEAIGKNDFAVFGQGLRLGLKRVILVTERSGWTRIVRLGFVVVAPMLTLVVTTAYLSRWFSQLDLALPLAFFAGPAALVAAVALAGGAVAIGAGISSGIELLFNARSPLEVGEGSPEFGKNQLEEARMYYERAHILEQRVLEKRGLAGKGEE